MATKKRKRRPTGPRPPSSAAGGDGVVRAPARGGAAPERRERKEQARQARERARKQARRAAATRRALRAAVFSAGIVVAGLLILNLGRPKSPTTGPTFASGTPAPTKNLPGLLTGNQPWSANTGDLQARLQQINITATPTEGSVQHIHQHLDIYIDGQHVVVPADIGIANGTFAEIHTHDTSGLIHVESNSNTVLTLGQFFDVWGVKFTTDCIGGYCTGDAKTLKVYVNGHLVGSDQDPAQIELAAHEEIAIVYGTASEGPNPPPSSYTFPVGT